MHHIVVDGLKDKTRLSELPIDTIPFIYSKSQWKKRIKAQSVFVNDCIACTGTWCTNGDIIKIVEIPNKRKPYEMELEILYDDEEIILVNKPGGIPVSGNKHRTLENALLYNLEPSVKSSIFRPRFIHRLDAQTSGIVIAARTNQAMLLLQSQLCEHKIHKEYLTLVNGVAPPMTTITLPVDFKSATTFTERIKILESNKYGPLSLLNVRLKEGRTHQIRIHLSSIGHPLIGDKLYNSDKTKMVKGMYLHCWRVVFKHPFTGSNIVVETAIPRRFKKFGISLDDLSHH